MQQFGTLFKRRNALVSSAKPKDQTHSLLMAGPTLRRLRHLGAPNSDAVKKVSYLQFSEIKEQAKMNEFARFSLLLSF